MSNHRYKTWAQAADLPECSVRMEKLPDGLSFTEEFPEPIRFDPSRKRLAYRGLMFTPSYQFLRRLSNDVHYTTTIDALYQETANGGSVGSRFAKTWPWLAGAVVVLATACGAVWYFLR